MKIPSRIILYAIFLIIGIALSILIISYPFFHSAQKFSSCVPSSPNPLFSIQNMDENSSHSIRITISSLASQIVAEESAVLAPMMIHQQYIPGNRGTDRYLTTFVVDGKTVTRGAVNASQNCSIRFSLNPVEGINTSDMDIACPDRPC
ncbi:hypothetical protein [Methanoregula sp.]|uniref:hypothetical protein n=1 Tax=Methanoregula sp. TaxID=2052170 RepID=UPI002617A9E0|nr:hypothetical protein [Methanoregula sp.]MDD5142372.1 hypothetical protein [Methanoregula sp.]